MIKGVGETIELSEIEKITSSQVRAHSHTNLLVAESHTLLLGVFFADEMLSRVHGNLSD